MKQSGGIKQLGQLVRLYKQVGCYVNTSQCVSVFDAAVQLVPRGELPYDSALFANPLTGALPRGMRVVSNLQVIYES